MIKHIIDLLQIDEFYEGSYNVHIAKGLYNYETGIKEIYKQKKRMNLLKKRNKEQLKWLKKEL
jgi:hypothetical protein|tara:strand:+ start:276 stop:464 length:189 start_codon:yes stop_codon:yes gene_type:complete